MNRVATSIALVMLTLAGCSKSSDSPKASAPVASVPPPSGRQWTDVVSATPEGGYRMGNPNAPVQLVEYGSLSCPHCRLFSQEGAPALQKSYIPSGRVSYEFRSFLIHSPDAMLTLLAACRGTDAFFPMADQIYKAQDVWLNKMVQVPEKTQQSWQSLAPVDQFHAMANAAGMKGFLAARGLPAAQQDKCLSDTAAAQKLVGVRDHATNDLGVSGTPTFFINGQMLDGVNGWAQLEPRLKDALG